MKTHREFNKIQYNSNYSSFKKSQYKIEKNIGAEFNQDLVKISDVENKNDTIEKSICLKDSIEKLKGFILGKSQDSFKSKENNDDLNYIQSKFYGNKKFHELVKLIDSKNEKENKIENKNPLSSAKKFHTITYKNSSSINCKNKAKMKSLNEQLNLLTSANPKLKTVINNFNFYDIHCHSNPVMKKEKSLNSIRADKQNSQLNNLYQNNNNRTNNRFHRQFFYEVMKKENEDMSDKLFSPRMRGNFF
jgi:hypothetical protein